MNSLSRALFTTFIFLILLPISISGCSETRFVAHTIKSMGRDSGPRPYKLGSPYKIAGQWHVPRVEMGYNKIGIASWYGPNFHGKYTANGEVYNKHAYTAAHKTLPLPSVVKVTNLENGRFIKVRINDRGPFVGNRIIDLSYAAAKSLDMDKKGLAKVQVELMQEETLALFENIPGAPSYAQLFPKPAPKPSAINTAHRPTIKPDKQIFIQAGAFSNAKNANKARSALASFAPQDMVRVSQAFVNGESLYRVRVGPFSSKEQANQLLAQVAQYGHNHAQIIHD